jgi:hypothetical protein
VTTFEIWDLESGNALGEFAREQEALAAVRDNVRAEGPSAVKGIVLVEIDERGESKVLAHGDELIRLVLAS